MKNGFEYILQTFSSIAFFNLSSGLIQLLSMFFNINTVRIAQQEEFNAKGGKRSVERLQDDIRELEAKLESKRKENVKFASVSSLKINRKLVQ